MATQITNKSTVGTASSKNISNAADVARKVTPADIQNFDSTNPTNSGVQTADIADGAVATAKLADLGVTAAKLAAAAVTNAKVGPGAVTGPKLAPTGITSGSFIGHNNVGACTLTGAVIGQRVLALFEIDTNSGTVGEQSKFEAVITVNDQIQQTDVGNLSAKKYAVILLPAAA